LFRNIFNARDQFVGQSPFCIRKPPMFLCEFREAIPKQESLVFRQFGNGLRGENFNQLIKSWFRQIIKMIDQFRKSNSIVSSSTNCKLCIKGYLLPVFMLRYAFSPILGDCLAPAWFMRSGRGLVLAGQKLNDHIPGDIRPFSKKCLHRHFALINRCQCLRQPRKQDGRQRI